MDWKPIETAPKDGSALLAYLPGQIDYVARVDVQIIHWSAWGGGVWETQAGAKLLKHQVTHWMPLPSPPVSQSTR